MQSKNEGNALKQVLNFISEAGMLKRIPRSGWSVLGIKNAESVAEHSFRTAVIGYLVAQMEGICAYPVLMMCLFNDIQEARISDLHKMAQRYVDIESAEERSFKEQISALPKTTSKEMARLRKEYREQKTKASLIARDADILECLLQAKEYHEQGYQQAYKFMQKAPSFLRSKGARKLWRLAKKTSLSDWWQSLSQFKR